MKVFEMNIIHCGLCDKPIKKDYYRLHKRTELHALKQELHDLKTPDEPIPHRYCNKTLMRTIGRPRKDEA